MMRRARGLFAGIAHDVAVVEVMAVCGSGMPASAMMVMMMSVTCFR